MSEALHEKKCVACEGWVPRLTEAQQIALKKQLDPDWQLEGEGSMLTRCFTFKGFGKTMAFVNAVAWVAMQENHHPDLKISYNTCTVSWTTHAIHGLSENDFIAAAKVDALL